MNRKLMSLCAAMILVVASILPIVMVPVYTEPIEVYVVAAGWDGSSNYILSHGDGTFSSQEFIGQAPTPYDSYGCGIGDFDNDGCFDYVIGGGYHIYLYEKLGPGNNFAPPVSVGTWTEGRLATDFAVADYNKDGKMDFVLTHEGTSNSELYLGNGDLTFTRTMLTNTQPWVGYGADSADFNNDGNPDFAVAQCNWTTPYYIYVNLGNGVGTFTTTSFEACSDAFGLTAADFDNDTKVDIVSGGVEEGWYFYKGNRDGTFQFGVPLSDVNGYYSPIDNYDFDNDGNQDIIMGYGTSVLYYSGNGDGTFTYKTEITGGSGYERIAISAPPTEMVPIVPGPRARFTWDPEKPSVNEPVTFNASTSKPVGMPIVRYAWDFETDGIIDAYGITAPNTFSAEGTYLVTLNVTDSQGFWDTETHTIRVVSLGTIINDGVSWLVNQQNPDGSWGFSYPVTETAFAVLKLEEHAVDPKYGYGLPSPFDPRYPYHEHVEKGLNYIFAHAYIMNISVQPAGDPDTNGNGKGIYFKSWDWDYERTYQTGIVMMAIAGSRAPDKVVNVPGSPVDGWTYKDVLQDSVDYLAFGQNDAGWGYYENQDGFSSQFNTGWATYGLGFAEAPAYGFACTIPEFVKTELTTWIDYIQNDVDGDPFHGGAGDTSPYDGGGVTILNTGHLLYMMAFVGYTVANPRVHDAVAFIVRWWNDPSINPGWRGWPGGAASYYAMFNVMNGLTALGIHEIDGIDWQNEFEHVLKTQQLDDGSWPVSIYDYGDRILSTSWALLTLQKVAAIPGPHGPLAYFTWDPRRPQVNDPLTFDASLSIPGWNGTHEMPIVSYAWDFETDGVIDAYRATATHTYPAVGTYMVTLKVTDSRGLWDTQTHIIKVVTLRTVIEEGVTWLANQQNPDGSWGSKCPVAETAFAVLKLEEHAVDWKYGYEFPSPFDPRYPYHEYVEKGLNYIFANAHVINISMQPAGNPDTNGNGKGVYFGGLRTYETGVVMMAIAGSRAPDKVVNVPVSPIDGWTYKDVLQDSVDYLAFGQNDAGWERGGWGYYDNTVGRSDQSCSGWATFGLGFAESPTYKFMCTIPAFVKIELNIWIDYIQNDVDGDTNHGGAGYSDPHLANILRTGHLLYMMAFVGDTATTPRAQDAVAYLVRHWNDPNWNPGWKGGPWGVASYQAMLNVMKGLFTLGIHEIDGIDWQRDFEHVLKAQQLDDGSWPVTQYASDKILSTEWALLTLEKVAPPPIRYVDIKPGSWPNPINLASRGVLPVAICGTADFDVTTINVTTIKLTRQGVNVGVSPIRWAYEDVATPWTGEPGGGHALGGDGYLDLTLKFSTQEVRTTLGLDAFLKQKIPLIITGNLNQAAGGTHFTGQDYVWILNLPGDANDDMIVNIIDVSVVSAHWYPGPPIGPLGYDAASDLNGDGNVNILDIAMISSQWAHFWQP